MDSSRLILVFVISFVLLILSQKFLFKSDNTQAPAKPEAQQTQPAATTPSTPAPAAQVATAKAVGVAKTAQAPAVPLKQATAESETVVENDLYKITFSNKGGLVKSWILKKYKDENGKPLELVHQQAASEWGYPLSLWTWDQGLRDKLNSALYVTSDSQTGAGSQPGVIQVAKSPATINFDYSDGNVTVHKSFTFDHSYVVKVETSVTQNGSYVTALPAWPAGFGDLTVPATYAGQRIDYSTGDSLKRLSTDKKGKDISGGRVMPGPFEWGGAVDQYFGAIFLPDQPKQAVLAQLRNAIKIPKDPKKPDGDKMDETVLGTAMGYLNAPNSERVFVGPKALDVLGAIHANGLSGQANAGSDLKGTVDFGIFAFIGRPLFAWLKWTQQHWIPNWGWAIIFITVVINLALLPLRITSMKSALKMQKLAPQMKSIQEKYKKFKLNDPRRQEQNAEIGALYKQHGVNPAGGCLPLIIQMPFLFAFYTMLASAIELRQASWLWLNDLAGPDRYFLIPIAIVISMMVLQKMTPQAGISAEQQRMMNLMMPLMIGFMSWSVASGLGLYWVTSQLVGIAQQSVMNRTELGKEIRAIALKRAAKQKK